MQTHTPAGDRNVHDGFALQLLQRFSNRWSPHERRVRFHAAASRGACARLVRHLRRHDPDDVTVLSAHAISLTSHETPGDYWRIRLLAFFSRKATSKDGGCPL